jgi:hypothetical protein
MEVSIEERIAILKEAIVYFCLYATFGIILLTLGLYLNFSEGVIFFYQLNNDVAIYIIIGVGAFIFIWSAPKAIKFYRAIANIKEDSEETIAQNQFNKLFHPELIRSDNVEPEEIKEPQRIKNDMDNETKEKIAKLQKQIIVTSLYEAPGAVLVGLGVYAKFAANGNAFLSILNNQTVVNSMLMIGVAIMLWGAITVFGLLRQISELQKEKNI